MAKNCGQLVLCGVKFHLKDFRKAMSGQFTGSGWIFCGGSSGLIFCSASGCTCSSCRCNCWMYCSGSGCSSCSLNNEILTWTTNVYNSRIKGGAGVKLDIRQFRAHFSPRIQNNRNDSYTE